MLALIRLCRPHYSVPMALTFTLTVSYAAGGDMAGRWASTAAASAALMLVIAGAYALNDAIDVAVDRVNAPRRPVASGKVPRRSAAVVGVALMAAGVALGGWGRGAFPAVLAAVAGGLAAYDALSKRLGPFKQVAVAVLMTSIYPLALAQAGGAIGPRAWSLAVFPAWMFLTSFGYEMLKDIRDAGGDPAGSALLLRPRRWRTVANAAIVLGAAALIGPSFAGCKWIYATGSIPAIAAALASTRLPVRPAIRAVYLECVVVGIAATADVLILGM